MPKLRTTTGNFFRMLRQKKKREVGTLWKPIPEASILPKPVMHIAYYPLIQQFFLIYHLISKKIINFPSAYAKIINSPYFDHDAFTNHALHGLDTPDRY